MKGISFLIDDNSSDPTTGRCLSINQSPMNIPCGKNCQQSLTWLNSTWGRLRKRLEASKAKEYSTLRDCWHKTFEAYLTGRDVFLSSRSLEKLDFRASSASLK